jgi:hypothetical protein
VGSGEILNRAWGRIGENGGNAKSVEPIVAGHSTARQSGPSSRKRTLCIDSLLLLPLRSCVGNVGAQKPGFRDGNVQWDQQRITGCRLH